MIQKAKIGSYIWLDLNEIKHGTKGPLKVLSIYTLERGPNDFGYKVECREGLVREYHVRWVLPLSLTQSKLFQVLMEY